MVEQWLPIRDKESVKRIKSLNAADTKLKEYLKSTEFVPVKYLKNHAIVCQKYNYHVSNFEYYDAQLSIDKDHIIIEEIQWTSNSDYEIVPKKSPSLYKLEHVSGFIYGGMATKFWMQRQAVLDRLIHSMKNSTKDKDIGKNLPLFNWECITIQLQRRDLDLVVKNELDMEILIKYLIV